MMALHAQLAFRCLAKALPNCMPARIEHDETLVYVPAIGDSLHGPCLARGRIQVGGVHVIHSPPLLGEEGAHVTPRKIGGPITAGRRVNRGHDVGGQHTSSSRGAAGHLGRRSQPDCERSVHQVWVLLFGRTWRVRRLPGRTSPTVPTLLRASSRSETIMPAQRRPQGVHTVVQRDPGSRASVQR